MKFNEIQKELKLFTASEIARALSAVFGQSSSLMPSQLHGTDTHYSYIIASYISFYYLVAQTSTTESPATMIIATLVTSPVVTTLVTSPVASSGSIPCTLLHYSDVQYISYSYMPIYAAAAGCT